MAKNRGAVVARMLLAVVAVANAVNTSNFNTEQVEKEKENWHLISITTAEDGGWVEVH